MMLTLKIFLLVLLVIKTKVRCLGLMEEDQQWATQETNREKVH